MEIGISTFGEIHADKGIGNASNAHRRMHQLIAEAKLADETGLDVYALGEHHRPDFMISSPEVALAAIAPVTKNIRLSSAVTVLSSADPVRTYQNFATLDLISDGRAEIMAGRGSFIESFPLFGYDLNDYDELFTEKLDLLLHINNNETINWKGVHRADITNLGVYPRPYQPKLPIWIAVGGTPASVVRAGSLGLPLTIAMLGGSPAQFKPLVDLYRSSAAKNGYNDLPLAMNAHFHISDDSRQAADEHWPSYEKMMNRIGRERGWSPITRQYYEMLRSPEGPLLVGSPQEVADKIIAQHKLFGNSRYLLHSVAGDIQHDKVLRGIELLGTKVAPLVKQAVSK